MKRDEAILHIDAGTNEIEETQMEAIVELTKLAVDFLFLNKVYAEIAVGEAKRIEVSKKSSYE